MQPLIGPVRRRVLTAVAGLALCTLVGTGCSVTTSSSSGAAGTLAVAPAKLTVKKAPARKMPAKPATSVTVTDKADGMTITLPLGYQQATDPADIRSMLLDGGGVSAAQLDGGLAAKIRIISGRERGARFDMVLVNAEPAPVGFVPADIGELAGFLSQGAASAGGQVGGHRLVTIGGNPGLLLDLSATSKAGLKVRTDMIFFVRNSKLFTVIVGGTVSADPATLTAVLNTLHFSG